MSCAEQFGRLARIGFVDAWRATHGPGLARRPRRLPLYSHHEREERISDHSVLVLDLDSR